MATASDYSRLPAEEHEEPTFRQACCKVCKRLLYGVLTILVIAFVLAWLLQFVLLWWATTASGCSPQKLEGYTYPGGGSSEGGNSTFNLVPKIALLTERRPG